MRFFYALILFLLSSYIMFWAYVFTIPTPRLTVTPEVDFSSTVEESTSSASALIAALATVKKENTDIYSFDPKIEVKRNNAVLLYGLLTFAAIVVFTVLFHKKSYILLPVLTSTILAFVLTSLIWTMTNSIPKEIYLDLQSIRANNGGLKALLYLAPFFFLEVFMLAFGRWYKIP